MRCTSGVWPKFPGKRRSLLLERESRSHLPLSSGAGPKSMLTRPRQACPLAGRPERRIIMRLTRGIARKALGLTFPEA